MGSPSAFLRTLIVAALAAVLAFAPAHAQQVVTITTTVTTWTYDEGDDAGADTIDEDAALLDDEALADDAEFAATRRYAPAATLTTLGHAKARFGPFSVIDASTVRMAGDVTSASPRQFAAMLATFPGLRRLEMVDCPGSLDEEANLILARAIRRQGMETVVPAGGSIRSGAVELWLAGATRRAGAGSGWGWRPPRAGGRPTPNSACFAGPTNMAARRTTIPRTTRFTPNIWAITVKWGWMARRRAPFTR